MHYCTKCVHLASVELILLQEHGCSNDDNESIGQSTSVYSNPNFSSQKTKKKVLNNITLYAYLLLHLSMCTQTLKILWCHTSTKKTYTVIKKKKGLV